MGTKVGPGLLRLLVMNCVDVAVAERYFPSHWLGRYTVAAQRPEGFRPLRLSIGAPASTDIQWYFLKTR
jgi:hypothetical protein